MAIKWKTIDTFDIKNEIFSFKELKERILSKVPKGTNDEEINIEFFIYEEQQEYYDDYTLVGKIAVQILDKE